MPKKVRDSSLKQLILCLSCILLLITGCQRRDSVIAGVDIPIPEKMTRDPDKVFEQIPGFLDAQDTYQGKVTPMEIFSFYQEVMAAKGWQPTARFSNGKDQIAYTKDNRVAMIRYNQNPEGTTVMTIMVGTQDPPK